MSIFGDTPISDENVVEIPLSKRKNSKYQGMFVATVSIEDEAIADLNWTVRPSSNKKGWYAWRREKDENGDYTINIGMHQLVLERMLDRDLEEGEFVDHIDGNGLNNCRDNLRRANRIENSGNQKTPSNNKTGFKGVTLSACGTYTAHIRFNKKTYYLGTFVTAEDAHLAYCAKAKEFYGDFANDGKRSLIGIEVDAPQRNSRTEQGKRLSQISFNKKIEAYRLTVLWEGKWVWIAHYRAREEAEVACRQAEELVKSGQSPIVLRNPLKYKKKTKTTADSVGVIRLSERYKVYALYQGQSITLGYRKTAEEADELRRLVEERISKGLHPKIGQPIIKEIAQS
jgi:hypothetical protein